MGLFDDHNVRSVALTARLEFLGQVPGRRQAVLVGGNGYAAKCAPALGGLAAGRLLGQPWPTEVERRLFERAPGSKN